MNLFCKTCSNFISQEFIGVRIQTICNNCGVSPKNKSALITTSSDTFVAHTSESIEKTLSNVPFDRSMEIIKKECHKCHLPYKSRIIIGSDMKIYEICKCEALGKKKKN